jgi:hypothetical protein
VTLLAVKAGATATPEAFVTTVAFPPNVPLAPDPGALNVTLTPETALPLASRTVAASGVLKAVFTCALWPLPAVAVTLAAGPARFVTENKAETDTPFTDALTLYGPPAMALAVKVGEVATPDAFVNTVALPVNVPLAPDPPSDANVTLAPGTGLPPESVTVATNGLLKEVFTCALWPPPEVATMLFGGPTVTVMLNCCALVAVCAKGALLSVTVTLKLVATSAPVGVPEITPVLELRVSPAGSEEPFATCQF